MKEPVIRFESPEAKGKPFKGELSLTAQSTPEVVFVPETTDVPPLTDDPKPTGTEKAMGLKGGLGIYGPVDVYVRLAHQSPAMIGVKYQFLGVPEVDATDGNFSASVLLGGGFGKTSDTDTSTAASVKHELKSYALETGALFGYRIFRYFLPYAGGFYSHHWNTGEVNQPTQTYPIDETGNQWSGNLGLQFGITHVLVRGEFAAVRSSWSGNSEVDYVGGLSLGGYW